MTVLPAKEQSVLLVQIPFFSFLIQAKQLKNSVGQQGLGSDPCGPFQLRIFWEIPAWKPPFVPRALL